MSNIYKCVDSFSVLLDTEYHIILGRKGVEVSLVIRFNKKECFHLMGLQHLVDRPDLRRDREIVFDEIRSRKINIHHIESSDFNIIPCVANSFKVRCTNVERNVFL